MSAALVAVNPATMCRIVLKLFKSALRVLLWIVFRAGTIRISMVFGGAIGAVCTCEMKMLRNNVRSFMHVKPHGMLISTRSMDPRLLSGSKLGSASN